MGPDGSCGLWGGMSSIAAMHDAAPAAVLVPIRVRPYTPADRARWDEFVQCCPEGSFFHRIGWKDIIESCFGHRTHYFLAERGHRIVGVLPIAETKSFLFGHALVSLPWAGHAFDLVHFDTPGAQIGRYATVRFLAGITR